jgi:hypothetical protein
MLDALVCLPALALAAESAAPPARASGATYETAFVGGLGAVGGLGVEDGDSAGGLALTASVFHRISFVELGAELYGAAALGGRIGSFGGLLGLHLGSEFSARLLAAAGGHRYSAVGTGLLSDDPGVSGSSPYVGGRVMLGYSFPRSRLFLGALWLFDEDLERRQKSVTYTYTGWLDGGDPSQSTSLHWVGQTTWGVLFVVGREFDLAGY